MDDFSVFWSKFDEGLYNLSLLLIRRKEMNLVLNYEKCHFMMNSKIILGYIITEKGVEFDKAK